MPAADPDGASESPAVSPYGPGVDAVLVGAVDEAARLLDADGAMVYLLDPDTDVLRFAFDAGIRSARSRRWVRRIELPIGTGMFGRAVADRAVVKTDDYANDAAFPHSPDADKVVEDVGIRSMVVAPMVSGDEVFGALGTFSTRTEAFDPAQIALVRSLADHAAAAMANARLIADLDRSRRELSRRAEIERSLREIAARISSASDLDSVLQRTVDEASRLIHADGAILDVLDTEKDILRWAFDSGLSLLFSAEERADLWIELGVGATGRALAENRVIVAGDNLVAEFPKSSQSELFFGRTGFRSMIAAPIAGDAGRLGVIEVYSRRPNAFDAEDGQLIQVLASHAAIAITNARLIEELARSRGEQARTAGAERALREIAARMTAMRDQDEILKVINEEAARLLGGSGAMINLTGVSNMLNDTWTHLPGRGRIRDRVQLLQEVGLEEDAGVSGRALRTRQVEWSDDYLDDERFAHTPERDTFVRDTGVRSVISAPLVRDDEVLGVLTVYGDEPGAFGAEDATMLGALADQGAVTIMNARLIEELERSREEVARRADSERTLREINARVSAILDPGEVLQRIVDEAARLLESDGARIDLYDDELGVLRWGYSAGEAMQDIPDWAVTSGLKPRQGVAGLAFAEERPLIAADYTTDDRFETTDGITSFVQKAGIRAVLAAPLPGEDGPIGVISVVSRTPDVYREVDAELLTGLASQASIALVNARLMKELEGSQAVIERRAAHEQALREIAARITAIREPGDLLQHVVGESARLLRADGALLELYDPADGTLHWAYDAGLPESQRRGLQDTYGKLGEGVSGKAISERRVIVIDDYLASDAFVHTPRIRPAGQGQQHPLADRGADRRRGRPARHDRGLPHQVRPVRRDRRGRPGRPCRPGRGRDDQCPPDRRAGSFARRDRAPRGARAIAPRHRRADHLAARPGRGPRAGRRGGQAPARIRRSPSHAARRGSGGVDPGRGRRRRPAHGELDQDAALPAGRGDQRPRRPRRHAGLDLGLPDRPAHPAREGRHHDRQPARVARHGGGPPPLARGGRDRDVGDLVPQATILRARGP